MVNTLNSKRHVSRTGQKVAHYYAARGGCLEVLQDKAPEVLISGPAGTGKSRACLEKIFGVCLATPNVRALILRKTLASLGSTALVTWRRYVIKEALETGEVVYYGGSSEEPPQYRFRNGSTVVIGGLDKPVRIMSSEYDLIYIQEATECTLEDLEFVNTRLRNHAISFQQLIMDCNPAGDKHWLKLRCNDSRTRMILSRHEDNPVLFDENGEMTERGRAYMSILDNLTGVRHKRLRLGLWVAAEGVIYENFDPYHHVLPWTYLDEDGEEVEVTFPDNWPRYWVIDFGFVDPFVLKCFAHGPDGEFYMYREIYMTHRTVEEHAKTIMDIVKPITYRRWYDHINRVERVVEERHWIERKPSLVICDHDAEGRRTFEKATGLGTQPAVKNVYEGINAQLERFKLDEEGNARFYYMADALVQRDQRLVEAMKPTCTVEEHGSYIWKVDKDGVIPPKEIPDPSCEDHGMDTDRYLTAYFDLVGLPSARQL